MYFDIKYVKFWDAFMHFYKLHKKCKNVHKKYIRNAWEMQNKCLNAQEKHNKFIEIPSGMNSQVNT